MFTLCATCNMAIESYDTVPMFTIEGRDAYHLAVSREWVHYAYDPDLHDDHFAVPVRFFIPA